jgi:hypothetical protein
MPDQPQSTTTDRFRAEMPQIPGVSGPPVRPTGGGGPWLVVCGLVAVVAAVFVGGRLLVKSRRVETTPVAAAPQIDVPATTPELSIPTATESDPVVAHTGDLAKPWDSQAFTFRNRVTGENVPALLVRLPIGSPAQASGYWALEMRAAYSTCELEYVQDFAKLRTDYSYRQAGHPMVGNPCSRTLYDPLKYATLPGNILARGAIVQGSDLRPPLGIEIKVRGKDILATRME